jgi:RNA polymerase sigma factor (TIGR02999 family)
MQAEHGAYPPDAEVTRLLAAWRDGDLESRDRLMQVVYARVRAIAADAVRRAPGGSLTPTDVAHEALMRLLGDDAPWADRRHFFNVVAKATRQVLVDAARRRGAIKRGGDVIEVSLGQAEDVGAAVDERLLRLDDALRRMVAIDARRAQVVELHYFGGFENTEIAAALDVSVGTVERDLRFARAWLKDAVDERGD